MRFVSVVLVRRHNGLPEAFRIGSFVIGSRIGLHSTLRRTEIGSVVGQGGEHAGDVLPHQPAGACSPKKSK